jgi:hypothetical protein
MSITIYHKLVPTFTPTNLARVSIRGYQEVAVVDACGLDDAYCKTQNVHASWMDDRCVKLKRVPQARSTSVGDLMRIGHTFYEVDMVGFKQIIVDF